MEGNDKQLLGQIRSELSSEAMKQKERVMAEVKANIKSAITHRDFLGFFLKEEPIIYKETEEALKSIGWTIKLSNAPGSFKNTSWRIEPSPDKKKELMIEIDRLRGQFIAE